MKKIVILFFCFLGIIPSLAQGIISDKGYRGYLDVAVGDAYNLNTAQKISTNNMQWYGEITTTHGYVMKNWFIGGGFGYYHSFRDKENIYPIYAMGRYTFESVRLKPYIEARAGIVYDPFWIEKVQKYGTLGAGLSVYKGVQAGVRLSIFSRPSRYFTANAAIVIGYVFGK